MLAFAYPKFAANVTGPLVASALTASWPWIPDVPFGPQLIPPPPPKLASVFDRLALIGGEVTLVLTEWR